MSIVTPFARPLYVMLKPAGAGCNLACDYCYYLEKAALVKHSSAVQSSGAAAAPSSLLSDDLLETFIAQYLAAQTMPQVLFTWHGGEPLLRPISFYRRALELQRKYGRGRQIDNCLQTNGTLLTDEWCTFFREHHFLIGISIDGPKSLHDAYRHDRHGQPTFERVMNGIRLLQRHGVEWNAMATVNSVTAHHPVDFYRFFRDIGCQYLQFTPVVERRTARNDGLSLMPGTEEGGKLMPGTEEGGELMPFSVTPHLWGSFLCQLYDEWVQHDVGRLFVQLFDATLANWVGEAPGLCALSTWCGGNAVMETDGSVYACDHFVFPKYRLGSLQQHTLTQLLYGEQQSIFGRQKLATLSRQCRECRFLFACNGECPRNRFVRDCYGTPGHNYLCGGYRMFFSHVAADMDFMRTELLAGRAPANIMEHRAVFSESETK